MSYKYLEHEADIALVGIGKTLKEAFQEGAKALFDIMVDIKTVKCKQKLAVAVQAPSEELLFIEWLNALLAEKDVREMMFSDFRIETIKKHSNLYKLKAVVCGETFSQAKHKPKIEVKAATYSGLKIEKKNKRFYVQCVCDV